MAGLFDFLGNLAPVLGPAARGYTGGQLAGEQAKINLLRQQDQDQLRRDQLDLNRLKLKQDAQKALQDAQRRMQELGLKAAISSLEYFNNPQNAANHDEQAKKIGGVSSLQLRQEISNWMQKTITGKDAGPFPVPRVLEKFAAAEGQGQPNQPQGIPPPLTDQATRIAETPTEQFLGSGPQHFRGGQDLVRALQGQTDQIGPPPSMPVIAPPQPQGFVPQLEATTAKTSELQQRESTGAAREDYLRSQIAEKDAERPFIEGRRTSEIERNRGAAVLASGQAAELPEKRRQADEKIKIEKEYKQAVVGIQQEANRIKKQNADTARMNADTLRAYREQQIQALKIRITDAANKLPEEKKILINQLAETAWTKDSFGDLVPNEGNITALERELGMPKGSLPRGADPTVNPTANKAQINVSPENLARAMKVYSNKEAIKGIGKSIQDGTFEQKLNAIKDKTQRERVRKIGAILRVQ